MQINSSLLSAGLSLYQSGQQRVDDAGAAIASNSLPVAGNSQVVAELTDQMIELKIGEHAAQVGARVIRSADEVLGTLIDTQA